MEDSVRFISTTLNLIVALISVLSASAGVPHLVNYQGRLTDSLGTPLDGSYNITFSLYDVVSGGSPIWTEAQQVSVSDGLFQVTFGSDAGNPLEQTEFDPSQVWLGVAVTGSPEFSPRTRFMSVPYAYKSEIAETALSTGGSGWILAGNLGDLDAGNGQIAGYPTTEYEYGMPLDGNIHRARCVFVQGPGLVFHTIEPYITSISVSTPEFRYGGFLYMKGTIVAEDDGATSTNWYAGVWTFNYSATDGFPVTITGSFGFSGSQVYVRKL
jgi:hypothetical protein